MDVVIIGAGGHGRVVLDILRAAKEHKILGFLDADESLTGTTVAGVTVLGHPGSLLKVRGKARGAIVAVGDNRARISYAKHLRDAGLELINAIHPTASLLGGTKIGSNVVIAARAVLCTESIVEDSVILNTACVVDHECHIAEGAHIAPGALLAGRVKIGSCAFIGLGAKIIQCLTIGDHTTIGAGAVVLKDIPPNTTAVGVPAKPLKKRD